MSRYLFHAEELYRLSQKLNEINGYLNSSCSKAVELQEHISDSEWSGKSHDAMVAFMDLTVQFHKKFQGSGSPLEKFMSEYEELQKLLSEYYMGFDEFIEVTKF